MRTAAFVVLSLLGAGQLAAQHDKGPQAKMIDHQKRMLLAMADSMPERLYRDKATPAQRDFAQQIHHAASAAAYIVGATMGAPRPNLPDTATAFNSRQGLKQYITGAFDLAKSALESQTDAARNETVDLFGTKMPRWQVWDEIFTHTVWTAGQVVANFRKHGMAPPAFTFF